MRSVHLGDDEFVQLTLQQTRDALTHGYHNAQTTRAVQMAFSESASADSPLRALQRTLERIRGIPPGRERVARMNTFVRTLGAPSLLARFIDVLNSSISSRDAAEAEIAKRSRRGRMHCVYGWAGQTLMLASQPHPVAATEPPSDDMDEFLGYPPAEWDLSIHIWQPNPGVQGFASVKRLEPNVIVEPPHSHPFSFVSYVSKGEMHQSIYAEETSESGFPDTETGRYAGVELERVDGVWPPHHDYRPSRLTTLEDRVHLGPGQSYFLPPGVIHDVEIDREQAARSPTITLFLCAEATVKPKAYLVPRMAEFHRAHPDLKDHGQALSVEEWQKKLAAVSRYLRGDSHHLRLDEIFECTGAYGFMHI